MVIEGVDPTMAEEGKRGPRRKPIQLTIPDDARAVLDRVGNASDYVSRMVVERRREWTQALYLLVQNDWHVKDIAFACEALGGWHQPFEAPTPAWVAQELRRRAPTEARQKLLWLKACGRVEESEPLARALTVVSREWWAGNADLQAALLA